MGLEKTLVTTSEEGANNSGVVRSSSSEASIRTVVVTTWNWTGHPTRQSRNCQRTRSTTSNSRNNGASAHVACYSETLWCILRHSLHFWSLSLTFYTHSRHHLQKTTWSKWSACSRSATVCWLSCSFGGFIGIMQLAACSPGKILLHPIIKRHK